MKTQTYIKTKIALARRMELSRPALDKYLSLPGAPKFEPGKGYDLASVLNFIAANAQSDGTAAKASDELKALRCRELAIRCDRLAFALKKDKGEYVLLEPVVRTLGVYLNAMRNSIFRKLVNEWPCKLSNIESIPEVREITQKMFNELMDELRNHASLCDIGAAIENAEKADSHITKNENENKKETDPS